MARPIAAIPITTIPPPPPLPITNCNHRLCLLEELKEDYDNVPLLVEFLHLHTLSRALTESFAVPLRYISSAHETTTLSDDGQSITFHLMEVDRVYTKAEFGDAIGIPFQADIPEVTLEVIFAFFNTVLLHTPPMTAVSHFRKSKLPPVWQFLTQVILKCLVGRTSGMDQIPAPFMRLVYGLLSGTPVDYVEVLWNEFVSQTIKTPHSIAMARFWSIIIHDLVNRHAIMVIDGPVFEPQVFSKFRAKADSHFRSNTVFPQAMLVRIPRTSVALRAYYSSMGHPFPGAPTQATEQARKRKRVALDIGEEGAEHKVSGSPSSSHTSSSSQTDRTELKVSVESESEKQKSKRRKHIAKKPGVSPRGSGSGSKSLEKSGSEKSGANIVEVSESSSDPEDNVPIFKLVRGRSGQSKSPKGEADRKAAADEAKRAQAAKDKAAADELAKKTAEEAAKAQEKAAQEAKEREESDQKSREEAAAKEKAERELKAQEEEVAKRKGKESAHTEEESGGFESDIPPPPPFTSKLIDLPIFDMGSSDEGEKKTQRKPKPRSGKVARQLTSISSTLRRLTSTVSRVNKNVSSSKSELVSKINSLEATVSEMRSSFDKALKDGLARSSKEVEKLKLRVAALEGENEMLLDECGKWRLVHTELEKLATSSSAVEKKVIDGEGSLIEKLVSSLVASLADRFPSGGGSASKAGPSTQGGDMSPPKSFEEELGLSEDDPAPLTEEEKRERDRQDAAWLAFLKENPSVDVENFGYLDGRIVAKDIIEPALQEQVLPMPPPSQGRILRDDQIRPHRSYNVRLAEGIQLDLPMDPNSIFFDIWTPSVEGLPRSQIHVELTAKNSAFYKANFQMRSKVWSEYLITKVGALKKRSFKGQPWFEIKIERSNNYQGFVSDADFPNLNPNDLYMLWHYLSITTGWMSDSQKTNRITACLRVRRFLDNYLWDIFRHDGQLGPLLAGDTWLRLQPVDRFEGIDSLHSGATKTPSLGVIFKAKNSKQFVRASQIHYYPTEFLLKLVEALHEKKKGDRAAATEFAERVQWWLAVREWGLNVFRRLYPDVQIPESS